MKRALITGITGQDGSYLAELLLSKPEYEVHGLVRRSSSLNRQRIDHLLMRDAAVGDRFHLHYADLADASSLAMVMEVVRPDEVYNLGRPEPRSRLIRSTTLHSRRRRPGHVAASRSRPPFEPIKAGEVLPGVELGDVGAAPPPQGLDTPFHPRSPYACAKVYGHWQTINYREAYGLFACSGVLFNHESPRRGESFVTRKVTLGAPGSRKGFRRN